MRAFLYLRVSTGRQEQYNLSVPDQRAQCEAHVLANDGSVEGEFVEASTATDDSRSAFQAMIERACDDDKPVDVIVVHSFSRFYRNAFEFEFYLRKLAKHGVRVQSVTQPLGNDDDPAAALIRSIFNLFDEYQSKENGKHVLRAMKENFKQGFWNGSPVPLGYRLKEVERRGTKIKRILEVDPVSSELVRLIFRTYLVGSDGNGPMGVKALVSWLNAKGYRTARGELFGTGSLYTILTNETYVGISRFNRRSSKNGKAKSKTEVVEISVPSIIDREQFDEVQRTLKARNPKTVAPRETTGPILLTGIAVHVPCNGSMTLRTGTSRSGQVYRYYACATCGRQGPMARKGQSIPMAKLDALVTDHLCERLLKPERLSAMLSGLAEQRTAAAEAVTSRVLKLQAEVTEANNKLRRLYRLVEDGDAEIDDLLRSRIDDLRADRAHAEAALERAKADASPHVRIDPAMVEAFGNVMRHNIRSGTIPFRKAYLKAVVNRVEVDGSTIRIIGQKDKLERLVRSSATSVAECSQMSTKWRTREDSNL